MTDDDSANAYMPAILGHEGGFEAAACAPASRAAVTVGLSRPGVVELAEWLPRLGPVLWLERRAHTKTAAPVGVHRPMWLVDHPAIAMLPACQALHAYSAVTPQGPREWLCFHVGVEVGAKLFLLPDSDMLMWDQMQAALRLAPVETTEPLAPTHSTFLQRAMSRTGNRWRARLFEFRLRSMPWLTTLDAHPPLRISLLGLDIAQRIVRDEHAEWMSPLHAP